MSTIMPSQIAELDDTRIAQRHLAGDPQAFGVLVDRYHTPVLTFMTWSVGDGNRAEELVEEVFIQVFQHLHRFDQTQRFSIWIYTLASQLAKKEMQRGLNGPRSSFAQDIEPLVI